MRIHFIAIGGSIMHSLAIAVKNMGHTVSGSDDEIYEPSRSRLLEAGLLPAQQGWFPEKINPDMDIIVLGMHARADNPELVRANAMGIPVQSFPEFMYQQSKTKKRIVVAGSHGKTTTSGMIAHALAGCGVAADRMIGSAISDLKPVQLSDAPVIILEGDEYLSSPLDKRAKFLHYHPDILVITGLAWDHMNVFPTYEDYLKPFIELVTSLPPSSVLIWCAEDDTLKKIVNEVDVKCRTIPYKAVVYEQHNDAVCVKGDNGALFGLKIFGRHNMENISAAQLVVSELGISANRFYAAMADFSGAQKRLQKIFEGKKITAYLDFAHAPSKVRATVHAVKEKYPKARVTAILELHTFSSLNPDFLPQYGGSLDVADDVVVHFSPHTLEMKKLPELTAEQLTVFFQREDILITTSPEALQAIVLSLPKSESQILLWMSSGRFDGLDLNQVSMLFDAD